MVPNKKSGLEGLAAVLSALGGARTPVGQALVQAGLFIALVFGTIWWSEHGGPTAKAIVGILIVPGFFIGCFLFIRVAAAVVRETRQDIDAIPGQKSGKSTDATKEGQQSGS